MALDPYGLALEYEACLRADPIRRFIDSLQSDEAEGTLRLREEYEHHVKVSLMGEPREAMASAMWVASHAQDVAYRWASLRKAIAAHAAFDVARLHFARR